MSEEVTQENTEQKESDYIVRTLYTGDRVYLIRGGKRAWIKNPETLQELGFSLGEETTIAYEKLLEFVETDPIDLRRQGSNPAPTSEVDHTAQEQEDQLAAILGYTKTA